MHVRFVLMKKTALTEIWKWSFIKFTRPTYGQKHLHITPKTNVITNNLRRNIEYKKSCSLFGPFLAPSKSSSLRLHFKGHTTIIQFAETYYNTALLSNKTYNKCRIGEIRGCSLVMSPLSPLCHQKSLFGWPPSPWLSKITFCRTHPSPSLYEIIDRHQIHLTKLYM